MDHGGVRVAFLFVIVWKVAPGGYLGAAWLLVGAVLFELGLRKLPKHFRWLSYFVSAAGFWNMFWDYVINAQIGSYFEAISLAIATVVCFSVSARIFRPMPDRIGDWEREWCRDLYAAAGALFAMTLVWLTTAAASGCAGVDRSRPGAVRNRSSLRACRAFAYWPTSLRSPSCVRLFTFDFAESR